MTTIFRAAYICQSEDMIDWQIYLLERGYRHAETKNIYYKANALNCFIVISDVSTIEEFTEKSFDDFRSVNQYISYNPQYSIIFSAVGIT